MTITINPQASDVVTIQISDADQITLNTTAIVLVGGESGGGNADTLNNQAGSYYLNRSNHTGSQAISTVTGLQTELDSKLESVAWGDIAGTLSAQTDLQDALDLKLDSADYNDRFLGLYASFFDLEAAHPTANAGDYAQVDLGIGSDVIIYAYDVSDEYWAAVGSSPIANTDALPEGSANLYFTGQRVRDTPLTGLSTATATPISAADSVLSAAGKLQGQASANATAIASKLNTADAPATVRGTALTGLSLATATAITATDTVLSAAGKLQAQISAGGVRKFAIGYWYNQQALAHNTASTYSNSVSYYSYFVLPHAVTISKLNAPFSAGAAGRSIKIRFYSFVTGAAVSPIYEWAATANDTNEYTLPSALTLAAGSYYIGLHNNGSTGGNQAIRSILSQVVPQLPTTAIQVTSGATPTGLIASATYADALPATVPVGATIYAGNQPAIGLFIAG